MRKNSTRNLRINEEVRKEMDRIIRYEIKDPRIHPMTTVSNVYVAPDLKTCKVYISVLGTEEEKKETLKGLVSAAGFARRCLAGSLNLRTTPEIKFIQDDSIEYGINMIKKIEDVVAEDKARSVGTDNTDQA